MSEPTTIAPVPMRPTPAPVEQAKPKLDIGAIMQQLSALKPQGADPAAKALEITLGTLSAQLERLHASYDQAAHVDLLELIRSYSQQLLTVTDHILRRTGVNEKQRPEST